MVNKVTLIGNLGADPEVKHLESGVKVARISCATSERFKDKAGELQDKTEWHNVILWREQAETAERILKKGMKVYFEGKISYRKYQDKDGVDKYITDIVCNTFKVIDWNDNKSEGGGASKFIPTAEREGTLVVKPVVQQTESVATNDMPQSGDEGESDDDGLPF